MTSSFELVLPERVHVVEMLPRDGFQRLDEFVPTEEKVDIIDRLGRELATPEEARRMLGMERSPR